MGIHNSSRSRSDRRVAESHKISAKMKGFVAVFSGILVSGSVSGAPQNYVMGSCTSNCNIQDLSNLKHNQISTNFVTSRNKVDYNFDNIFTNIDSSSSSFNNYYNDAFPFFGIRRFRREALEDGEGVAMDQDRSARSFQRARQNGLASRYQMMGHVKQPRLTENNREMSEQMEDMLQQRMELLEDQLMREQLFVDDTNARDQALLEQRQMKERERMENKNRNDQRLMDQRNMNDQTLLDQRNQMDQYRMDQRNEMEQNLMDNRNLMSERMLEDENMKELMYLDHKEKVIQDQMDQKQTMLDRLRDGEASGLEQQQRIRMDDLKMVDRTQEMFSLDMGQRMGGQKRMDHRRMGSERQMSERQRYLRNQILNRRFNNRA